MRVVLENPPVSLAATQVSRKLRPSVTERLAKEQAEQSRKAAVAASSLAGADLGTTPDNRLSCPDDDFGRQLTEGFVAAVKDAIAAVHADGLAVSGYENGIAVEVLPDGTQHPIDESHPWSPTDWRDR